jgi:hypothetical protein
MAKKPQVDTEVLTGISLDVTQAELDACLKTHLDVLRGQIRDPRPADGLIVPLVAAIRILKSEIIARDDKLGRGSQPDEE